MKGESIETFSQGLAKDDVDGVLPEPVYYGGTTERSVSSGDIVAGIEGHEARTPSPPATIAATDWCGTRRPTTALW